MILEIYGEAVKSLKTWWRQRILVIMGFMVPIALTFFFIQAFNMGSGKGFPLAVVNHDNGPASELFINYLGSENGTIPYFKVTKYSEEEALSIFNERNVFAIVYIPKEFSESLDLDDPLTPSVLINNIHEDLSKNLRLGLEGRIYEYTQAVDFASRPSYNYDVQLANAVELKRVDYMQMGIIVFNAMFLGFLLGGTLGAMEKGQGTIREIIMSPHGYIYSRIGKIAAAIAITLFIITMNLVLNWYLYGLQIKPENYVAIYLVCILLSSVFSTLGVTYGFMVGTFTLVPLPRILLSFTFWMISGAINPIEFSAGSYIFSFMPSTAAIKILTAVNFGRSLELLPFSWNVLVSWFLIFMAYLMIDSRRHMR